MGSEVLFLRSGIPSTDVYCSWERVKKKKKSFYLLHFGSVSYSFGEGMLNYFHLFN